MTSSSSTSTSTSLCSTPDHDDQAYPHSRSYSLPCLPNPNLLKIEQQLKNLNLLLPPSMAPQPLDWISSKLVGLCNLYSTLDDLIRCPSTQQCLLHHSHGRLVEQALETSVTLLSTVSTVRDLASSMKDQLADVQSSLRRKGASSSEESSGGVNSYIRYRKSTNKKIGEGVRELKHMLKKNKHGIIEFDVPAAMTTDCNHQDPHLGMVVKVLREVGVATAAILGSVLSSFSIPVGTSKTKRQWQSFMSKMGVKGGLMTNSTTESSEIVINEVGSVDLALLSCGVELGTVQGRMRTLETGLQSIEGSLDGVSRCLVQYRVSFLNMLAN